MSSFFSGTVLRLSSSGGTGHHALQLAIFQQAYEVLTADLEHHYQRCSAGSKDEKMTQALSAQRLAILDIMTEIRQKSIVDTAVKKTFDALIAEQEHQASPLMAALKPGLLGYAKMSAPATDLLLDAVTMGRFGQWLWDISQRYEMGWVQKLCLLFQSLINYFSYRRVYQLVKARLNKLSVDYIIDTQPMCTKAVCQAVVEYNQQKFKAYQREFSQWQALPGNEKKGIEPPIKPVAVRVKKFSTDLPTNKCTHYLAELKALSQAERQVLDLHMLKPMAQTEEQRLAFWRRWCGDDVVVEIISDGELDLLAYQNRVSHNANAGIRLYELHSPQHWPIRPLFKSLAKVDRAEFSAQLAEPGSGLTIKLNQNLINAGLPMLLPDDEQAQTSLSLAEEAKVMSIMLGSNGGQSIYAYVKAIISKVSEIQGEHNELIVFAFCGRSLDVQQAIIDELKQMTLPKWLTVLPLGFQPGELIAKVQARSDCVIIRTGGTASMEALAVCQKQILLHSQYKPFGCFVPKSAALFTHRAKARIPVWEGGNAEYILRQCETAAVVTPMTFMAEQTCIDELEGKASNHRALMA